MSHYTVAVFHKPEQDVDEMLAPYYEGLEVAPYIGRTKEEIIESGKKHQKDLLEKIKENPEYTISGYEQKYIDCKTDEDYYVAEKWYDDDDKYDFDGNEVTTYNPHSKWDWYSIGGRWDGILKLKDDAVEDYNGFEYVNEACIKDIDFALDQDAYEDALRFWDIVVEHQPLNDGEEEPFNLYREEYYREYYGDRETYAKRIAQFSTYAVLWQNGIWYEPGKMGWFGCADTTPESERDYYNNYKERFIDNADPEWVLTIVDCHI